MGGFAKDNSYGDLIYTNEDTRIHQERQYFWEAFRRCRWAKTRARPTSSPT